MSVAVLTVWVPGKPRPQGSKTLGRGGHMYDSAKGLKEWRHSVSEALVFAAENGGWLLEEGECWIDCEFIFERPKRPSRSYPPRNDTDKLLRAVCDAVTASGVVWVDDDQATRVVGEKHYGPVAGAYIRIGRR